MLTHGKALKSYRLPIYGRNAHVKAMLPITLKLAALQKKLQSMNGLKKSSWMTNTLTALTVSSLLMSG